MATCANCGTTIVFGGIRHGQHRFCKEACQDQSGLAALPRISPDSVRAFAMELRNGPCPKCGKCGVVDYHESHSVVSALVMTFWKSHPQICCAACARKAQGGHLLLSLVAGWWGFPFGLIMTPVQIVRNIVGMSTASRSAGTSKRFREVAAHRLARLVAEQRAVAAPPTAAPIAAGSSCTDTIPLAPTPQAADDHPPTESPMIRTVKPHRLAAGEGWHDWSVDEASADSVYDQPIGECEEIR